MTGKNTKAKGMTLNDCLHLRSSVFLNKVPSFTAMPVFSGTEWKGKRAARLGEAGAVNTAF